MTFRKIISRYQDWPRLREDAGQALVETAVSAAFMIVILLGALELGRVAYASIEMANSARAAVQVACMNGGALSLSPTTPAQYLPNQSLMLAAAQADAAEISSSSFNPNNNFALTPGISCVCANGALSTCTVGDCNKSFILVTVTATTSATFDPIFHFPGILGSYTLYGHASQQVLPQ